MQQAVEYWCHLIGISHPGAIEMAVGVVGGLTFVGIAMFALGLLLTFVQAMFQR